MPDNLLPQGLAAVLDDACRCMDWAEQEIAAAQRRHPARRPLLWHSFKLLTPTSERMRVEFVHRAHCAELLERVAAGADTRPGTAAEVIAMLSDMSLQVPLGQVPTALYLTLWHATFPDRPVMDGVELAHHQQYNRSATAGLERTLRRQTAVADRRLGKIICAGRHNGRRVECPYAWARKGAA